MAKTYIGRAFTLELPSGAKVRARRPSLQTVLSTGDLPSELTALAVRLVNGEAPDLTVPDQAVRMLGFMDRFIRFVLIEPKIADESNVTEDDDGTLHGQIALIDLDDRDKQYLWRFGQGGIAIGADGEVTSDMLATFRNGRARADSGPSGAEVSHETVVAAGAVA